MKKKTSVERDAEKVAAILEYGPFEWRLVDDDDVAEQNFDLVIDGAEVGTVWPVGDGWRYRLDGGGSNWKAGARFFGMGEAATLAKAKAALKAAAIKVLDDWKRSQ
jgi:hypothetical protein